MKSNKLIINAQIINEGEIKKGSILIEGEYIQDIFQEERPNFAVSEDTTVIDAENGFLMPGVIDDQVHFRQPGLTHKADIYTESKAAVVGGITSLMEMPNTKPQTITLEKLDEKFEMGAKNSFANYSFYMGATNDNLEEIVKIDPANVCGLKVFMGASTGNMLVDDQQALENIFKIAPTLVATHCEDEQTIRKNLADYKSRFGNNILPSHHPEIRSREACFLSSSRAISIAKRHNTRLHILHLSTKDEMDLFDGKTPLHEKKITSEVCIHHLWFDRSDYEVLGNLIKWNPAVKNKEDREALWESLLNHKLDVVATDHAPHLLDEKLNEYTSSASGGPLVQHSLQAMAHMIKERNLPFHLLTRWMCHNPAIAYKVRNRGFIRKGYFADLVILKEKPFTVSKDNILYKCGWSPFENHTFDFTVTHTIINGEMVNDHGKIAENFRGRALRFDR